VHQQVGNLITDLAVDSASSTEPLARAQVQVALALPASDAAVGAEQKLPAGHGLSCHEAEKSGNSPRRIGVPPVVQQPSANDDSDPLEELLYRALAASKARRGRPPTFDDHAKGQLVALLSVGMSMRQAAAVLGVSHTAVQKILKADPALAEEITSARFQAQLQPLACVIREARRSWKAATWLLKYLDGKIATHEETPDESRARKRSETEELVTRARG